MTRRLWRFGSPGPVFPPLDYLHQQKEGHQQTAGPRGQTHRRTGALWPRRRGDAQGRSLRKDVPRYNMLTVTTDPDLYRNELFRTPLRANYLGMKRIGLRRTALEAAFLVSEPNNKTHRWPSVMLRTKNILRVVLGTNTACERRGWKNAAAPASRFRVLPESRYLHAEVD